MSKPKNRLAELPKSPGVYFFKDNAGEIIYIGKAANLKNRISQYFQKSRTRDAKTDALISEISKFDIMSVDSELDALFLEAEMIRRYMPRYNILLRDDKSMVYIRIDYASDYPTVSTSRRPLDDGAKYFGPYLSTLSVRQALKILRRIFPFATGRVPGQKRANLHYHLGLDPGLEDGKTSLREYRANLRKLMAVIEGKRKNIERELEKEMKRAAKAKDFEVATAKRNQLFALQRLSKQMIFNDKEFLDISKDQALNELVDMLKLKKFPKRIEGYDISHMSGTDVVASMVVFNNGVTNKAEYRKFKTRKNINDDFYNMRETLARRFSEKNLEKWAKPDIILIDGGKGQVSAAMQALKEAGLDIPLIGLAKRFETIIIPKNLLEHKNKISGLNPEKVERESGNGFVEVELAANSHLVKLLQRIRDESHRFAVSYHSTLKTKRQTSSLLDDIPGIGPATRKKLIRHFGSVRGVSQADKASLEKIVGAKKAKALFRLAL